VAAADCRQSCVPANPPQTIKPLSASIRVWFDSRMSTLIQFPIPHEHIAGYRFGHAEVLLASERLLVAGNEVALSPMAYKFLLGLCRARGALLTRNDAFDLLWPGGGSGSDEALAQIVLKVRQALASEGRAIATVRGRGFRLETPIETVSLKPLSAVRDDLPLVDILPANTGIDLAPAELPAAQALPDSPTPTAKKKLLYRPQLILMVVLALLALIIATQFFAEPNLDLDGFAIDAKAFGPITAQGAKTLATALTRDDEGDRTSARQLLQGMADSEPRSAAPAFFLTLWLSGNKEELRRWRQMLKGKLPQDAPAYVQLLSRWVGSVGDSAGVENELLSAALKLQPTAWRLHLARAHVSLRLLRFDEALADLRLIPFTRLSPRYAMFVMSDRASLGDAATMQAELPQLIHRAPVLAEYVRGRIALAQGHWPEAQIAFETTAQRAEHETLIGAISNSWLYAATAAGAQEHWQEMQHDAEQARRIGTEHALSFLMADAEVVIGYSQYRRGLGDQADASWDRADVAIRATEDSEFAARLWLQRARLQPAWATIHAMPDLVDSTLPTGLSALISARQAWLHCDLDAAKHALIAGESAGLDTSYFADEIELLRQDLGLARNAVAAPPQLPYPGLARWITYWESARSVGTRACASTPAMPIPAH